MCSSVRKAAEIYSDVALCTPTGLKFAGLGYPIFKALLTLSFSSSPNELSVVKPKETLVFIFLFKLADLTSTLTTLIFLKSRSLETSSVYRLKAFFATLTFFLRL